MRPHLAFLGALLAALACAPGLAHAQAGGAYNLEWNTLTGGGQSLAVGGSYVLSGATGQPDAGELAGGAYALAGGFWNGATHSTLGAPSVSGVVPKVFAARVQGSNPFAVSTAIQLDLPTAQFVQVTLFGVDGRVVRRLFEGYRASGRHTMAWNGADATGRTVSPGIYFGRVLAGPFHATIRLVRVH